MKTVSPVSIVRPEIAELQAYQVPASQGLIKLDAMENPFEWPDDMQQAWLEELSSQSLNRYPDPQGQAVVAALREAFGIPKETSILLGNGSDEIIQIIAMTLARPGAALMAPEPGFSMYAMIARFTGMRYVGVPLNADFSLDCDAMLEAIERETPELIFLAYPNNPTGNLFDDEDIEAILRTSTGLVVIDEAYFPFADASWSDRIANWSNLVVLRTVSKMGLAGLRLGYLLGSDAWIEQFDKVRLPYNINVLTQQATEFALRHKAVFDRQAQEICRERARLLSALQAFDCLECWPSATNFLLARVNGSAGELHQHLLGEGILVKNLHGSSDALAGCLRFTVGSESENSALLAAISSWSPCNAASQT